MLKKEDLKLVIVSDCVAANNARVPREEFEQSGFGVNGLHA
jgi:hypothetical protein